MLMSRNFNKDLSLKETANKWCVQVNHVRNSKRLPLMPALKEVSGNTTQTTEYQTDPC